MTSNFIGDITRTVLELDNIKHPSDIFEYFHHLRTYSIIEKHSLDSIEEARKQKFFTLKFAFVPSVSMFIYGIFQKRGFFYFSLVSFWGVYHFHKKANKQYESELNLLKEDYSKRVKVFKRSKDLRDLNPDFLQENSNIKEIKLIQEYYTIEMERNSQ